MAKRELGRQGSRPFDVDALLQSARRETGVEDVAFLDGEALHALCDSLAATTQLHFIGRRRAERLLLENLIKRIRLRQYLQQYPQISEIELARPVFLIAPFRTGTTFLHRLLAQDPAARAPRLWEALQAPPAEPQWRGDPAYFERDYRVPIARKYIEAREKLSPEIATIHPSGVDVPEECFGLLESTLLSHSFVFYAPVEGYLDWLDARSDQEWVECYRLYADQLRLLQWWYPGEHWVLKTPFHLWAVDAICEVFPDAVIVQQHRDPTRCVASYCSLTSFAYAPILTELDREQIGRLALRYLRDALARNVAARAKLPAARFVDIDYPQLMDDPMACVERVYAASGRELSTPARTAMGDYLRGEQRSHPQRRHDYSLAEYGLSEDEVNAAFEDYAQLVGASAAAAG
jgi:hypothetical protein